MQEIAYCILYFLRNRIQSVIRVMHRGVTDKFDGMEWNGFDEVSLLFFLTPLRGGFWLLEDGFAIVCTLVPWAGRLAGNGHFLEKLR